ncbi:MAG: prepilin-type N-terminal cleavage/methylation domain-containing protein [Puniceicoccales bacterium]|jgi:prepilin-type N-terminal cleavage/methylation domain-containing protein|nr:prepilin-type N-terminal cleavage/methylation domain-containing protein [Puniceicoccales bacterium]
MKTLSTIRARAARAFTLLELLVATAIMALIIALLIQVADGTFRSYNAATSTLRTLATARVVLTNLQQDLQTAIIPNDRHVWFHVEHTGDIGNLSAASTPQIMFFSAVPDRIKRENGQTARIPGDICAVNYQIAQRSPFINPGEFSQQTYSLYRAVIDAKATFAQAIPAITGYRQNSTTEATTKDDALYDLWRTAVDGILDINNNRAKTDLKSWGIAPQNYLVGDIAGINLVFYYYVAQTDGTKKLTALAHADIREDVSNALRETNPSEITVETYTKNVKIRAGQVIIDDNASDDGKTRTLQSIDVSVICLGPDGALRLRNLQQTASSGRIDPDTFNSILREHGDTHTVKVNMAK